jgi:hypothetical protein
MIGLRIGLVALVAAGLMTAGCGGDDEGEENGDETATLAVPGSEEAAALQEEIAGLSDEQQVERVGEAWAELYAERDETMCGYLHPDLGGASSCASYADGALTGSNIIQESFAGTTVESVDVKGETAVAEFSNGERVKFQQDPDGAWKVIQAPMP